MRRRQVERVPCPVHPWVMLAPRETCPELGERCGGRMVQHSVRIPRPRALTAAAWRRRGMSEWMVAKRLKVSIGEASELAHLGERALRWVEGKTIEDLL